MMLRHMALYSWAENHFSRFLQTRQWSSLELIASENFTSRAVMDCLGSALTNKVRMRY